MCSILLPNLYITIPSIPTPLIFGTPIPIPSASGISAVLYSKGKMDLRNWYVTIFDYNETIVHVCLFLLIEMFVLILD